MLKDGIRDRLGFAFFVFVALIAGVSAWQNPSILGWLYAFHNLLLAWLYMRRESSRKYDRIGLWLGLIAALLPTTVRSGPLPWYLLVPGLASYLLIIWSLVVLGRRFGIAPANRGLICHGPYKYIRHPMYLGELAFQVSLLFGSKNLAIDLYIFVILVSVQVWRIFREEYWIGEYHQYSESVKWRIMPGIW